MTLEDRVDTLERRVSRYRGATMALALVLVAGVTMGQTTRDVEFGAISCTGLSVVENGRAVIRLESEETGGALRIEAVDGGGLTFLTGYGGGGSMILYSKDDVPELVLMNSDEVGGIVSVNQPSSGKAGVIIGGRSTRDGGGAELRLYNRTGQLVANLMADEYGNGVVGAWNRKGKGRTLKPGP